MKRRPKKQLETGPVQLLLFATAPEQPTETELDRLVDQIVQNIRSIPVPEEAL